MKLAVRMLSELGADVVLAPERWIAVVGDIGESIALGDLVVERNERVDTRPRGGAAEAAIVLDTTHARDGLLDIHAALRGAPSAKSAKKLALPGDLVISRLRPYLRQIAVVHPRALEAAGGRPLALSTEFYVLAPRAEGDDLAFLLPFLLGPRAQAVLAAAQEGGHHPRVPRSSLLALRVPKPVVRSRRRLARQVGEVLDTLYGAMGSYQALMARG